MSKNLKEDFSFLTGSVRRGDVAYVALVDDERAAEEDEHGVPLVWHAGAWLRVDESPTLEWVVAGVCVARAPVEQGVFVGVTGQVLCVGSGDTHTEAIADAEQSPRDRGPLRGAAAVQGTPYAFGMGRQVYRRDGVDRWTSIDADMRPQAGDTEWYGLNALDGFSGAELYAAGIFGEIWKYDGSAWTSIASPTNLILYTMCCAEDENVYIGGQKATLLRGRRNEWEVVTIDQFDDDIWGSAWFRGRLYIATLKSLYTLEKDDTISLVDMGKDRPNTFYHLSSADGVLWSIGRKDVMMFDGSNWTRID